MISKATKTTKKAGAQRSGRAKKRERKEALTVELDSTDTSFLP